MEKEIITIPEINLIGLQVRTNNAKEMNPDTAMISKLMHQFFALNTPEKIYCAYSDYESDFTGDYLYFIGMEKNQEYNGKLVSLTIPAQKYVKFTTDSGPMPQVCINAWQEIWHMTDSDLGGKRAYKADFELYDARAKNPSNTVLDIFIGIK